MVLAAPLTARTFRLPAPDGRQAIPMRLYA